MGGSHPHEGNVISGGPNALNPDGSGSSLYCSIGPPGLVLLGALAKNNVIEGNIIGLNASASLTPSVPQNATPVGELYGSGQYVGVWIAGGSANRVGGSAAGAGNVIVGNSKGVYISGESASGNWVAGNQIGWAPTFKGEPGGQDLGVVLGTERPAEPGGRQALAPATPSAGCKPGSASVAARTRCRETGSGYRQMARPACQSASASPPWAQTRR